MNNTQDYSTLKWIRGELDASLTTVRNAFEEYVDSGDESLIDDCIARIHQVQGSLQMMQIYGGALLAEELEQVARAFKEDRIAEREPAAESEMLGIIQLSSYLEKLESGAQDLPILLMPLINELRSARDGQRLSEVEFLSPGLERRLQELQGQGEPYADLAELVRKVRIKFNKAQLQWYRDRDVTGGLRTISSVFKIIGHHAGTPAVELLFRAAHALVIAMLQGGDDHSLAIKQLFNRLGRYLRHLIRNGEEGADFERTLDLIKHTLYQVANIESSHPLVEDLRQAYQLSDLKQDKEALSRGLDELQSPDQDLFSSLSVAIGEDLTAIKDSLDQFIRTQREDVSRLGEIAAPMFKLADTLGMVGQGGLRNRLKTQAERINEIIDLDLQPDDQDLMAMASEILFIETSLKNLSEHRHQISQEVEASSLPQGEFENLVDSVMQEATIDMAKCKEAVTGFIDNPGKGEQLKDIAPRFKSISGAFRILKLELPAQLMERLGEYVHSKLEDTHAVPEQAELNDFADAITSIEYFMETIAEGRGVQNDILGFAEKAIEKLNPQAVPEISPAEPPEVAEAEQEPAADAQPEPDTATPVVQEPVQVRSQDKAPLDEVDSEIRDIFIEEAREELGVIQEYFPRWAGDHDDSDALTTFRRSFHTLKGSGRLVGATVIGELAWSIENLLNRVIDQTIEPSPEITSVIRECQDALPNLIDAHERGEMPALDVDPIMVRAFALADPRSDQADDLGGTEASVTDERAELEMDPTLLEIFESESKGHLQTLRRFVDDETQGVDRRKLDPGLTRAWHTLHGSAKMAEVDPIARVSAANEKYINLLQESEGYADAAAIDLQRRSVETLDGILAAINQASAELPDWEGLSEEIESASSRVLSRTQATESDAGDDLPMEIELSQPVELISLQDESEQIDLPSDFESLTLSGETGPDSDQAEDADAVLVEHEEGLSEAIPGIDFELEVPDSADESQPDDGVDPETDAADSAEAVDLAGGDDLPADSETLTDLPDETPEASGEEPGLDEGGEEDGDRSTGDQEQDQLHERSETESGPETSADVDAEIEAESLDVASGADMGDLPVGEEDQATWIEEDLSPAGEAPDQAADDESPLESEENEAPDSDAVISASETLLETQLGDAEAEPGPEHEIQPELGETDTWAMQEIDQGVVEIPGMVGVEADNELLEIFLEEARELHESIESSYQNWINDTRASEPIAELERLLHTLKGGARLAGAMPIGDLSHAFESFFAGVDYARIDATPEAVGLAQRVIDRLAEQIDDLSRAPSVRSGEDLVEALEVIFDQSTTLDSPFEATETGEQASEEADAEPELSTGLEDQPSAPDSPDTEVDSLVALSSEKEPEEPLRPTRMQAHREQVRVRSELLDRLVNHAGEANIYRARIEQQNTALGYNLDEMNQTVDRLRAQLRQMEIETEAQILFRYDQDKAVQVSVDDSFDPLELDRFSTIQQVSRSLLETVNDLNNIYQFLDELQKESDTLLQQQSRVMTDLQDGLMRTRMVPLQNLQPRLQRVVRQTCNPLGKLARLEMRGAESELDRSILERMIGPFEHLLRNAISHGIETPEVRRESGKDEEGRVVLDIRREGSDALITLSDDGAGIDTGSIRQRAIERGLLDAKADITDNDILQFVFEHGFSTADKVTQIAGRGVGLDVVVSEVKQLGGSLDISSKPGEGTRFLIRLPLTLAISDALLVELGEEIYAIPHTSIEGVVRVSYAELKACYDGEQETYNYAGQDYQVRYLGALLNISQLELTEQRKWYPLLLVRAGDHRVAMQVDTLIGNRQIVVKSVGKQISSVRYISGGTILGDGRVALILDITALVRLDLAHTVAPDAALAASQQSAASSTVMVVDDSITVRKVTGRLLERHGMHVITAKDGVDAVAVLQEQHPDIMLLDIEMPRMDGFELARHMHNSDELKHIPIIMITSRTGDKHRNLALELGVKRYLGKPYQENDLLENIHAVLEENGG